MFIVYPFSKVFGSSPKQNLDRALGTRLTCAQAPGALELASRTTFNGKASPFLNATEKLSIAT